MTQHGRHQGNWDLTEVRTLVFLNLAGETLWSVREDVLLQLVYFDREDGYYEFERGGYDRNCLWTKDFLEFLAKLKGIPKSLICLRRCADLETTDGAS